VRVLDFIRDPQVTSGKVVIMDSRLAGDTAFGEVDLTDQMAFPGFIEDQLLDLERLLEEALRMEPEQEMAHGRSKRFALVAARVMVDFIAFTAAVLFAYYLRFESPFITSRFVPASTPGAEAVLGIIVLGFPALVGFLKISGMYSVTRKMRILDRLPKIVTAVNALFVTMLLVLFLFVVEGSLTGFTILIWFFCILFIFMGRIMLQMGLAIAGVQDIVVRNTLIIGSGQIGKCLALKLTRHPESGLKPIGFLDDDPLFTEFEEPELENLRVLGRLDQLPEIVQEYSVQKVIIGFMKGSHKPLLDLVSTCNRLKVECSVLPRLFEVITDEIHVREIGGMSLVPLRPKAISAFDRVLKTIEDYTLAVLGLLIFWPVLLFTAIAIKLDSPGPVFYSQTRIGKDGKPFKFVKFRSMVENADELRGRLENGKDESEILWKIEDDPRVTRVGKWIRKFSIDEAPQIFNVLTGHMSLVGPRPGLPDEVARYDTWHTLRLNVKPGITGLWQVSGRSDIPFDEMVKYDYYYIERWSLWEDAKIILRTFTAVLSRKGAY
jgi:exopolysaccharide biosynthesis polyprenyl glycosylphosphotransferase